MTQEPMQGTGADSAPQFSDTQQGGQTSEPSNASSAPQHSNPPDAHQPTEPPAPATIGFAGWLNNIFGLKIAPTHKELDQRAAEAAAAQAAAEAKARDDAAAAKAAAEAEAARLLAEQTQADLDEYEQLLIDEIESTNQQRHTTGMVSNVKGGAGKSPTAAILANFLGVATQQVVTAIDNNPYSGTFANWLGIRPDQTMSVRQMHQMIEDGKVNRFADFSVLGSNRLSVQLIKSDRVALKGTYDHDTSKKVLVTAKDNSRHVVVDTGNGIGEGAVEAGLEESDYLVLPSLNIDDKLDGVVDTIDSFLQWGHGPIVKHAIIPVLGLRPGQTAEDYRKRLKVDDETILMGIPYDKWISNYGAIIPSKLDQQTRIACWELVLAASMVARYTQINGRDEKPLRIVQGQLVKLSSGRTPVLSYVKSTAIAA